MLEPGSRRYIKLDNFEKVYELSQVSQQDYI